MSGLVFALPKGRLLKPTVKIIKKLSFLDINKKIDKVSRKLKFTDSKTGNKFLLAKPKDIPAYVEHGAADLGITGKDVIMEQNRKLYELLDLGFGECRLVLAVPGDVEINAAEKIPEHSRIATSYPEITSQYFRQLGKQVEIIYLNGSVELAPQVGLADFIVDITSTGTTLRKNNLVPVAEIMYSSARLVVNKVSYKTRYEKIKDIRERGIENEDLKLSG
ncbi:MAG: ATP phosphoribosyltransferase [Halanaerobiales bacterium]